MDINVEKEVWGEKKSPKFEWNATDTHIQKKHTYSFDMPDFEKKKKIISVGTLKSLLLWYRFLTSSTRWPDLRKLFLMFLGPTDNFLKIFLKFQSQVCQNQRYHVVVVFV